MRCCEPGDLDAIFSPATAEREARRYRRRGLVGETRGLFALLRARGVAGRSLLEVGGGLGALGIELVRAGAARATTVELSPAYDAAAGRLIADAGVGDRVRRVVADYAAEADSVGDADIVLMQRVVCCYPDAEALVGAAAAHTRELLVITLPAGRWPWTHAAGALINLWPRMVRSRFRFFVHPTRVVLHAAERRGLRLTDRRVGIFWQRLVLTASRTPDA